MDENKEENPEDLKKKKKKLLRRLFEGTLKYFTCKITNHRLNSNRSHKKHCY